MQGPHVLLTFDNAWHYILALTYSWPTQIGHSEANIVAKFLGLMPPPPTPCWLLLTPPTSPPSKFYQFCGGGMQPHTAPLHAVPGGTQHHAAPGDPP